jgi:hypothetical protein
MSRKAPNGDPVLRGAAAASAAAAKQIANYNATRRARYNAFLKKGREINEIHAPRLTKSQIAELVEAERKPLEEHFKNRENFKKWRKELQNAPGSPPGLVGAKRRSDLFQYYYPIIVERLLNERDPKRKLTMFNERQTQLVKNAVKEADKKAEEQELKEAWNAHAPRRAKLAAERKTKKNINNSVKNYELEKYGRSIPGLRLNPTNSKKLNNDFIALVEQGVNNIPNNK